MSYLYANHFPCHYRPSVDFAPDFPKEAIPNFYEELKHFRIMPNGKELVLETLLKICHFETAPDSSFRDNLGAPPLDPTVLGVVKDEGGGGGDSDEADKSKAMNGDNGAKKKAPKALTYSQIRWIGKLVLLYTGRVVRESFAPR